MRSSGHQCGPSTPDSVRVGISLHLPTRSRKAEAESMIQRRASTALIPNIPTIHMLCQLNAHESRGSIMLGVSTRLKSPRITHL